MRDREREELLLQRLRGLAVAAGLDAHEIERLYRVIMEMSVAHQEATVRNRSDAPLRVAYQGSGARAARCSRATTRSAPRPRR